MDWRVSLQCFRLVTKSVLEHKVRHMNLDFALVGNIRSRLILVYTLDPTSSVLTLKLWYFFPFEALQRHFHFYIVGINHYLLFLVTTFLKPPIHSHLRGPMARMVCCGSESQIWKLSCYYRCKSCYVTYFVHYKTCFITFSFSFFLFDLSLVSGALIFCPHNLF